MDKLKYIKLKNEDGSYTDSIPLAVDSDHVDVSGDTLTNKLETLATKTEVQAVASGSPAGTYSTLSALTAADPNHNKIYIVTENGHWYYYNSGWQDGGIYQSTSDHNDVNAIKEAYHVYTNTDDLFTVKNCFLDSTGYVAHTGWNCTDFIKINDNINHLFFYKTSTQTSGRTYSFFSSNNFESYISGAILSNVTDVVDIKIPYQAQYMILCTRKNVNEFLAVGRHTDDLVQARIDSIVKKSTFDLDKLTIDSSNFIFKKDMTMPTTHKNWFYVADNLKDATIFNFKMKFLKTTDQCRPFIEFYNGTKLLYVIMRNAETGKLTLNLYDENITSATTFNSLQENPVCALDTEYEIKFKKIGRRIWMYVDNYLWGYADWTKIDEIKAVGYNFRDGVDAQSYYKGGEVKSKSIFAHFSLDDQLVCLKDITDNVSTYTSIFDSPYFAPLKELHDEYGCKFTLELFHTNGSTSLENVTDNFKTEFLNNSHWLKFAYHGPDVTTHPETITTEALIEDMQDVYEEIARFAYSGSIDKTPRMSFFSCTKEQALAMKENNLVVGLLTADDTRTSNVGLNSIERTIMTNFDTYTDYQNRLTYFRTETRLDGKSTAATLNILNEMFDNPGNTDIFIIFAHGITGTTERNAFETAAQWLMKKGIKYDFAMNHIEY